MNVMWDWIGGTDNVQNQFGILHFVLKSLHPARRVTAEVLLIGCGSSGSAAGGRGSKKMVVIIFQNFIPHRSIDRSNNRFHRSHNSSQLRKKKKRFDRRADGLLEKNSRENNIIIAGVPCEARVGNQSDVS